MSAENAIAIVGMSGRFPGAPDVETFWSNLCRGLESIERWDESAGGGPAASGAWVKAGGELANIADFDAGFFGLGRREAELMDPQHRLFLECAQEALESAGVEPSRFDGLIGVYGGCGLNTYFLNQLQANPAALAAAGGIQAVIASEKDSLATQAAYRLNLKGPAVTVQTACSTSLVAVQTACQSLLTYQCDLALAGGVTVRVPSRAGYLYQDGGILSPDGRCRAFSALANGTVSGSGAGVVALKRWEDALAAGDRVVAVIRGSAINNDGSDKVGYSAPGLNGQAAAIAHALAQAGVSPREIGYVEAHGTGTALGDPIEVAALTRVFGASDVPWCALGSLKPNVGHLDAAAGVAALIKAALAVRRGQIPASLNAEPLNSQVDWKQSAFFVNTGLRPWTGEAPRRAGVSSFGIGGTNVHLVVEEVRQGNTEDRVFAPAHRWNRERHWIERSPGTPQSAAPAKPEAAGHGLYRRSWVEDSSRTFFSVPQQAHRGRLLVLAADGSLAAAFRAAGHDVVWVSRGAQFCRTADGGFELNPALPADFGRLLAELKTGGPCNRVIHAGCLSQDASAAVADGDFDRWQEAGFFSLLNLARGFAEAGALAHMRLDVLVGGVCDVTGSDPLEPAKATLAGLLKVLPQEFPGLVCRMVDFDPMESAAIVDCLDRTPQDGGEFAWRGRRVWTQKFEVASLLPAAAPSSILRRGGVYMITGGLGKIGLTIAELLAERFKAKLVLVGRRGADPLDSSQSRRLRAMEAQGAEILTVAADVSNRNAVEDLVRQAERRFGAVNGVIHGAGATGPEAFASVATLDAALCRQQWAPKAVGVQELDRALAGRKLDFFMLHSSLSTVLGGLGFGAYAAANRYLEAYAEMRNRVSAYPWLSIAWDGWNFGAGLEGAIAPKTGVEVFQRLIDERASGTWIAAGSDFEERRAKWGPTRSAARAETLPATSTAPVDVAGAEAALLGIWREVLGSPDIDRDTNFFEAGGDSLAGIQMVSLVNQRMGISISAAAFFELPTVRVLAQRICKVVPDPKAEDDVARRGALRRQRHGGSAS